MRAGDVSCQCGRPGPPASLSSTVRPIMPLSFILAMIAVGIYFLVVIAALMIHGIWLAPFIERHGRRSAGFFVFGALPGLGLIQDYLAARQICRERGTKPRW